MDCYSKEDKHVIPRKNIVHWCSGIKNLRSRALLSLIYLSGCRVSESCLVQRKDFDFYLDQDYITVKLRTLKRRKLKHRTTTIIISKEKGIIEPLISYLMLITNPDKKLFPSTRGCQLIIKDLTGHGCHCLRHSRNTHLREKGFDAFDLKDFNDWATIEPAIEYVHANPVHLRKKMRELL